VKTSNELIAYIILTGIVVLVVFIYIWISVKLKSGGESMATIAFESNR
jgi:hypothetical protein